MKLTPFRFYRIYYLALPISPSYRPDCVYAPAKAMQLHRLRAHTPANEAADSTKSVSTGPDARNQPDWCRDSTSIQYFWTGEALGADSQQILMKILRIIILIYINYP